MLDIPIIHPFLKVHHFQPSARLGQFLESLGVTCTPPPELRSKRMAAWNLQKGHEICSRFIISAVGMMQITSEIPSFMALLRATPCAQFWQKSPRRSCSCWAHCQQCDWNGKAMTCCWERINSWYCIGGCLPFCMYLFWSQHHKPHVHEYSRISLQTNTRLHMFCDTVQMVLEWTFMIY